MDDIQGESLRLVHETYFSQHADVPRMWSFIEQHSTQIVILQVVSL